MRKMMNEQLPISKSSPLKARFYDYPYFTYPWHFHTEYEIIYVKEGTGMRFVGNNAEKYADGDILLLGSDLPHYMKSDEVYRQEGSTLRTTGTIIQFEKDFMHHAFNYYPHFVKIKNLLEEAQRGIYFPAGCSLRLVDLLESIPVETGVAMNPAAFCRFFKSKTGKSFKNYILEMRIGYACKLLLMGDMNISQISVECGFDTISHFNKSFKKHTGFTPSYYKKMMLAE